MFQLLDTDLSVYPNARTILGYNGNHANQTDLIASN